MFTQSFCHSSSFECFLLFSSRILRTSRPFILSEYIILTQCIIHNTHKTVGAIQPAQLPNFCFCAFIKIQHAYYYYYFTTHALCKVLFVSFIIFIVTISFIIFIVSNNITSVRIGYTQKRKVCVYLPSQLVQFRVYFLSSRCHIIRPCNNNNNNDYFNK